MQSGESLRLGKDNALWTARSDGSSGQRGAGVQSLPAYMTVEPQLRCRLTPKTLGDKPSDTCSLSVKWGCTWFQHICPFSAARHPGSPQPLPLREQAGSTACDSAGA